MNEKLEGPVAIVGGGLVGSGWAIIFSRAGKKVRIFDSKKQVREKIFDLIKNQLSELSSKGLVVNIDKILNNISIYNDLGSAVTGSRYIQESVFEEKAAKINISKAISQYLNKEAVVGSSTSGIPASEFTESLHNREKFLVAHPVNPPYLAQVVEIVPAPWTSMQSISKVIDLMSEIGQSPVYVKKETFIYIQ